MWAALRGAKQSHASSRGERALDRVCLDKLRTVLKLLRRTRAGAGPSRRSEAAAQSQDGAPQVGAGLPHASSRPERPGKRAWSKRGRRGDLCNCIARLLCDIVHRLPLAEPDVDVGRRQLVDVKPDVFSESVLDQVLVLDCGRTTRQGLQGGELGRERRRLGGGMWIQWVSARPCRGPCR